MLEKKILNNIKKVHFIGIGGSGMYPLARILKSKGYSISGSDNYISDTLENAIEDNLKIYVGHNKNHVKGAELVVYSAAVKEDNPELKFAKENNIPVLERAKLLGILMNEYKNLVAVSGTHGKTTTSSMLTHIFMKASLDPTVVIGGKLKILNGNSRLGKTDFAVCEACEYVDTFLNLEPSLGIILNIEEDHLDYFKNLEGLLNSFSKFALKAKDAVIVNTDDENSLKVLNNLSVPIIGYGLKETEKPGNANFSKNYLATNIVEKEGFYSFTVLNENTKLLDINLKIPGKHNVYNALACIAASEFYKIDLKDIKEGLESFTGVHRRFETLTKNKGITVMDDFAHHPTEIKSTLETVKKMDFKRIIAIFQPHTYSRTYTFLKEFSKVLSLADLTIVSEILAVREKNVFNIHSRDLVKLIRKGVYIKTFEEIADYITSIAKEGDLILTMGGGNIYRCANAIAEKIKTM